MNTRVPYNIVSGPCREELMKSFTNAYLPPSQRSYVYFSLEEGMALSGRIVALEYEDGSGHKFNFKGYFGSTLYEGFYDSHKRTGFAQPVAIDG